MTALERMIVNMLPIVFLMDAISLRPTYCEIMICPALEKPMPMNVIMCSISLPVPTADRPTLPTYWPTTIMSTML